MERRYLSTTEIRMAAGGKRLEGHAAVFAPALSENLGGFRERILPGAFGEAIIGQDIFCMFNHNPSVVLGRTRSGTLEVREDRSGLFFSCLLPSTQTARDLLESVRRGDITGASIGFQVAKKGERWSRENGQEIREITKMEKLFDCGPVTIPAYPDTSVSARSLLWPEGQPAEVRSHSNGEEPSGCYVYAASSPLPADGELASVYASLSLRLKRLL